MIMENEFYITELDLPNGSGVGLEPAIKCSKQFTKRLCKIMELKQKVTLLLPRPLKVKMTLEEVCKELGKDIEIVDYGVKPKEHDEDDEDDFNDPEID